MDGILPICDFMSVVTDVIYMAFRDFGEPDIKNYMNLIQQGHLIGGSGPELRYKGDHMILGKVSVPTAEVILWAAYLYCRFRKELEPGNEKAVRANKLRYKLYARQTRIKRELIKDTFLMKHFNTTMVALLKKMSTCREYQDSNEAENGTHDTLSTALQAKIRGTGL